MALRPRLGLLLAGSTALVLLLSPVPAAAQSLLPQAGAGAGTGATATIEWQDRQAPARAGAPLVEPGEQNEDNARSGAPDPAQPSVEAGAPAAVRWQEPVRDDSTLSRAPAGTDGTAAAEGASPSDPPPAAGPDEESPGADAQSEADVRAAGAPIPPSPAAAGGAGTEAAPPPVDPAPVDPVLALPRDLSPLGMYQAADKVVKGVMLLLLAASVLTWTIFLAKLAGLVLSAGRLRRSLRALLAAESLADAADHLAAHRGAAPLMLRTVSVEHARSAPALAGAGSEGLKERAASALGRIEAQAARRLQRGMGVLASIGSVAPFLGLFGTVWGIMNAFIGISRSQTTNLAVVAPGIAEALLATAMGLVAAIPAVVLYNLFARAGAGQRARLADAAAAVERLLSRDLDREAAGLTQAQGAIPAPTAAE